MKPINLDVTFNVCNIHTRFTKIFN